MRSSRSAWRRHAIPPVAPTAARPGCGVGRSRKRTRPGLRGGMGITGCPRPAAVPEAAGPAVLVPSADHAPGPALPRRHGLRHRRPRRLRRGRHEIGQQPHTGRAGVRTALVWRPLPPRGGPGSWCRRGTPGRARRPRAVPATARGPTRPTWTSGRSTTVQIRQAGRALDPVAAAPGDRLDRAPHVVVPGFAVRAACLDRRLQHARCASVGTKPRPIRPANARCRRSGPDGAWTVTGKRT